MTSQLLLFAAPDSTPSWVLTPGPRGTWSAIASSADGARLAAAEAFSSIHVSADSGASWTLTDAPAIRYPSLAASADGSRLIAAASDEGGGAIYLSMDGGVTWVQTGAPNRGWAGVAISADGLRALAIPATAGHIFRSLDGGSTWVESLSPSIIWTGLAFSADGNSAVAAATAPGAFYRSTDGGESWEQANVGPVTDPSAVAISGDGAKMYAVTRERRSTGETFDGAIYSSTDFGQTWLQTSAPEKKWTSIASSTDGFRLVAVTMVSIGMAGGEIYSSTDGGQTWVRNHAPEFHGWVGVASSADGAKMAAVHSGAGGGPARLGIYTLGSVYQPWIVKEPVSHVVPAGQDVVLHVEAEGGQLSYQWRRDGMNLADGDNLSGANSASLTITSMSSRDAGRYSVKVTNLTGSIVSTEPTVGLATWTRSEGAVGSSVAMSADGTRLAAAFVFWARFKGFYGRLSVSGDGGITWTDADAGSGVRGPVAMSSHGSRIFAGGSSSLYVSSDFGATWNQMGSGGHWDLACSSDGQTLLAIQDREMQISHDFGASWKMTGEPDSDPSRPQSSFYWRAGASSADGRKLVAAAGASTVFWAAPAPIYVSDDGGETWRRTAAPEGYWKSVASSADGSTLVAAGFTAYAVPPDATSVPGTIHISRDSGTTWRQAELPSANWRQVVCSADGEWFAAASGAFDVTPGLIYRSTDAGATWFMAGAPDGDWSSIASSADGTKFVASMSNGEIWISPIAAPASVGLEIARLPTGVKLSWPATATGFILQRSPDVGSGSWSVVEESPVLNDGARSITLSPDSAQSFYRLMQP